MAYPMLVKNLNKLLGLIKYYYHFIKNYANLFWPLAQLKKNQFH